MAFDWLIQDYSDFQTWPPFGPTWIWILWCWILVVNLISSWHRPLSTLVCIFARTLNLGRGRATGNFNWAQSVSELMWPIDKGHNSETHIPNLKAEYSISDNGMISKIIKMSQVTVLGCTSCGCQEKALCPAWLLSLNTNSMRNANFPRKGVLKD